MHLDNRVVISDDVLFQEVGGETVLLDLSSESYFGLDETATRIWQLIQTGGTLREVLETMVREFDVTPGQMERDLMHHLDELEAAGLVSAAHASGA